MFCCTSELEPHTPEAEGRIPPSIHVTFFLCRLPSSRVINLHHSACEKRPFTFDELLLATALKHKSFFYSGEKNVYKYSEFLFILCGRRQKTFSPSQQGTGSERSAFSSSAPRSGEKAGHLGASSGKKSLSFNLREVPCLCVR